MRGAGIAKVTQRYQLAKEGLALEAGRAFGDLSAGQALSSEFRVFWPDASDEDAPFGPSIAT